MKIVEGSHTFTLQGNFSETEHAISAGILLGSLLLWLCLARMKTGEVWSWVQRVICSAKNWGFYYNREWRKTH